MKIKYDTDTPTEITTAIVNAMDGLHYLTPSWCHVLNLKWEDDGDGVARVWAEPDYRRATIAVHPAWMSYDADMRRKALVHELMHLFVAPLTQWMDETLELVVEPGKLRDALAAHQLSVKEQAVCDLAAVVIGICWQ